MAENSENQDPYTILRNRIGSDPDFDRMFEKVKAASEAAPQTPSTPQSETRTRQRGTSRRGFLTGLTRVAVGAIGVGSGIEGYKAITAPGPLDNRAPASELNPQPEKRVRLFNEFFRPFVEEAARKRQARIDQEGEESFYHRVDKEKNQHRVQFMFYGIGEEKQYQQDGSVKLDSYENFSGSISIWSLNLADGTISQLDISRDIRLANARRTNEEGMPLSLRDVFKEGGLEPNKTINKQKGLEFTGLVAEELSGLSMDFRIVLKDTVIRDLIEFTGPIEVDVEKDHKTQSYRLDRRDYPEGEIKKGKQLMVSNTAMRYIMAEDKEPSGKESERGYRKKKLFKGIRDKIVNNIRENPIINIPSTLLGINNFIQLQRRYGSIDFDFDPNILGRAFEGLKSAIKAFGTYQNIDFSIPDSDEKENIVFHDREWGDGGVDMAHKIENNPDEKRQDNTDVLQEAKDGKMPGWMLIPTGGNPYAQDLVRDYWKSTRALVKQRLS